MWRTSGTGGTLSQIDWTRLCHSGLAPNGALLQTGPLRKAACALQALDALDLKTSSWIATPPAIRALGGALFCDRRYDTVFVHHNGAQSYLVARGYRGMLRV